MLTRREFGFSSLLLAHGGTPAARDFFYKPEGAWAADFIPFCENGRFYLFYLHDWRDAASHGGGTPWYMVSTTDFVHFTEHGEMLARAPEREFNIFTGSVMRGEGQYHAFYVADNPKFRNGPEPAEVIMHAVSDDLLHWKKQSEDAFPSPQGDYERDDWRDPFVFWNEVEHEYWMIFTARLRKRSRRRGGVNLLAVSQDLKRWKIRQSVYAPGLYEVQECPDLFRMGDWWYLIFSEASTCLTTRYRMARGPLGPWITPEDDQFDGCAFYAAKTAFDGRHRYLFGWLSTRRNKEGVLSDYNVWNWGGNLVVHELVQRRDGTLAVRPPATVAGAFTQAVLFEFRPGVGEPKIESAGVGISSPEGWASAVAGPLPERCKLEATIEFSPGTRACGLQLRGGPDLDSGYFVLLDPRRNQVTFDCAPRSPTHPNTFAGLERPLALPPGSAIDLKILIDGSSLVAYAGGQVAMSTRMYRHTAGNWGVFAERGEARFRALTLTTPA
jgi:beta-fructofuranosidase